MRATIDKAGRVVIPKSLRERLGIRPGEVEVIIDGAALRIEPLTGTGLAKTGNRLVIPASGEVLTAEDVERLRDADQR